MNVRSRIEWASMWGILAEHFATIGSISGNPPVAMYTVDCIRQLALKFLDKVQSPAKYHHPRPPALPRGFVHIIEASGVRIASRAVLLVIA